MQDIDSGRLRGGKNFAVTIVYSQHSEAGPHCDHWLRLLHSHGERGREEADADDLRHCRAREVQIHYPEHVQVCQRDPTSLFGGRPQEFSRRGKVGARNPRARQRVLNAVSGKQDGSGGGKGCQLLRGNRVGREVGVGVPRDNHH